MNTRRRRKNLNEAKKGARNLPPGAPGDVRSSGFIDPSNVDANPKRNNLPSDRGIMDQKKLYNLFNTGLKIIFRQGKGNELENFIEDSLKSYNRLKSAARILSDPKRYRDYSPELYSQDAKQSKSEILDLYDDAEDYLSRLVAQTVGRAYIKASSEDKQKIATMKDFSELPTDLDSISVDEAELISAIFFKDGKKASKEEAISKVNAIVNSFIKLDKEVMADEDTVHNMLTRLQTAAKTAKVEKDQLRMPKKRQPIAEPTAGYSKVDLGIKRKITKAFGSGDLDEVKAQLDASGRRDLVKAVGDKSEAQILKAYVTGKPIEEGFVSMYDLVVEDLLNRYRF
jgi:hypothetical protein